MRDEDFEPDDVEEELSDAARDSAVGDIAAKLLRVGAEAVTAGAEKLREKGEDLRARELVSGAASLTARGKEEVVTLLAKDCLLYTSPSPRDRG